ncbi:hypothetical protein DSECCO2_503940 [anaerobic digester metagenome]
MRSPFKNVLLSMTKVLFVIERTKFSRSYRFFAAIFAAICFVIGSFQSQDVDKGYTLYERFFAHAFKMAFLG